MHVENLLSSKSYGCFFPSKLSKEEVYVKFFHIVGTTTEFVESQKITDDILVQPFSLEMEEVKEEDTEISKSDVRLKFLEHVPSHADKKMSLVILHKMMEKEFQEKYKIPTTGNKMAKLRYSDFVVIWENFCKEASLEQIREFNEKLKQQQQK